MFTLLFGSCLFVMRGFYLFGYRFGVVFWVGA